MGHIFRVFDAQDSGCISYGVRTGDNSRWFVKSATTPAGARSLDRAREFHTRIRHTAVIPVRHSFTAANRPALVYPWVDGQVLYHPTVHTRPDRTAPTAPMAHFRRLPLPLVHQALERILQAHLVIAAAGFVGVDLYDGCFLYDFARDRMHLCDLDEYRPGPFTLGTERLPGSTRYMAPEETTAGAEINERTTVYALGRAIRLLMDSGDAESAWRGTSDQLRVVEQATAADPTLRYSTVHELCTRWRAATRHMG
ncbi:serine/threonine protein kinase [Yinghuangia aomiensis]|uniref:serine/threonine protein kinase n=1 Tax=Yinghuangia aomiensis TaxID=676205 RepID=UPI0031F052AD